MGLEEDSEIENTMAVDTDKMVVEEGLEETDMEHIRLLSLTGISKEKSLRLLATINCEEVVVLVYSGATCNFISEGLVRKLRLKVTETKPFFVFVGNENVIHGQGKCQKRSELESCLKVEFREV